MGRTSLSTAAKTVHIDVDVNDHDHLIEPIKTEQDGSEARYQQLYKDMLRKSYYLTLGVSRNESSHGIREAFRELAQRYHPDRIGPARLHFFQEILEAYHVLADPVRRSEYDRSLYPCRCQSRSFVSVYFCGRRRATKFASAKIHLARSCYKDRSLLRRRWPE